MFNALKVYDETLAKTPRALNLGKKISKAALGFAASALLMLALLCTGCSTSDNTGDGSSDSTENSLEAPLRIASLKGPTSIGLAQMMIEDSQNDTAHYEFQIYAAADEIAPQLAQGDIDIALIPANVAATLYGKTEGGITAIDVNTLGVLYALTADSQLKDAKDRNIDDLEGRTIYMSGKGTIPEYTVRCLLDAAGIADSVTLEFCSEPTEAVARLAQDPHAVGIVPQPYATAASMQNNDIVSVLDLNTLWDALAEQNDSDLPDGSHMVTGVTVVRTEVLKEHPEAVDAFLSAHEASAKVAENDPSAIAEKVVELGIVGNTKIAEAAIPSCNVVCLTGENMKDALAGYLQALYQLMPNAVGGSLPPDEFYYVG